MAPSVADLETPSTADVISNLKQEVKGQNEGPSYPFYYPHFDLNENSFTDPGSRADPAKPHLLTANTTTHDISPYLGTEVTGVQISQLPSEGLDELALYTAERKHPTSGNPKGFPEFHVVYRDADHDQFREYIGLDRASLTSWHSDSYERQTPGTTFFFILDQVEAYRRLSPEFQKRLEGLRAVHSGVAQADISRKRGGPVRREPIESEHPVVRVHPVTGEKAPYVNPAFTRRIVGYKTEESEYLLKFLDRTLQIRGTYNPGTVVVWDNRLTCHSATLDFDKVLRRHAVRLTPQAEVLIAG
ncbi:hypothetical protein C8F04DRAFT_1208150 [Mycena alexandri]|uniref:TauD/TfdA-like domain-containing protein n=1 Tax=Mycena alexandri TaxID=1745969 RepID=A0AAD6X7S0_9AGAR|nr:hypothetical protein C8F04DRAFT_1208150 [Mycena alexandri]